MHILLDITHREIISDSCQIKLNLDCDYNFQIDLAPKGVPFCATQKDLLSLKKKKCNCKCILPIGLAPNEILFGKV